MRLDVRLIARLLSLLEDLERDQSKEVKNSRFSLSLYSKEARFEESLSNVLETRRVSTRASTCLLLWKKREKTVSSRDTFFQPWKTTPAQLLTRQKAILQMEAQQAERGCDLLLRTVPFDLSDVFPIR